MMPAAEGGSTPDWKAFVVEARERIAARQARLQESGVPAPGAEAAFSERFDSLVRDLADLLEEIPEVERESHGTAGLRIHFAPTNREVRITPLEEQGLVHFVFGHSTLGTLHRAEHHASRAFGDGPPDVPRLLRQLLLFLIEGIEPRWLTERPPDGPSGVRDAGDGDPVLELPLE